MVGSYLNAEERENFEYPFGKRWVLASAFLSLISIVFAVTFLIDYLDALLMFFGFTSLFIAVMTVLKYYLYSKRSKESQDDYVSIEEERSAGFRWSRSVVLYLFIMILAFLSPVILSYLLDPMWWIIIICGFVPGISVPEIILYLYAHRKKK
jgi:uncharacterized ion transporter superfamily protein YfcC